MLISESIINFTTIVRSISTLKSFKHNEMNVALSKSKIRHFSIGLIKISMKTIITTPVNTLAASAVEAPLSASSFLPFHNNIARYEEAPEPNNRPKPRTTRLSG